MSGIQLLFSYICVAVGFLSLGVIIGMIINKK